MNIELTNDISADEYFELVESVGWKKYGKEQMKRALKNTMFMVKAKVDGKLAGMGRIVGDFGIACMLTSICVKPEFQHMGIGLKIVSELKRLVENSIKNGERIIIEVNPTAGNEAFYQKAGFKHRPEKMMGMYLWIDKMN